jgi:uncharacterized metal-binding protein
MKLNCLDCKTKNCRKTGADCYGLREKSLDIYDDQETLDMVRSSGRLVDNGRAGSLSRFQEVIEFCTLQGYKKIGLAYCFGLESLAMEIREKMSASGLSLVPARCSMGAVKECEIDPDKTSEVYSCNPAGQAVFLNDNADFVIEVGLCLGHDVIFHQQLKVPFTVLLVKDRTNEHNPLKGIREYQVTNEP